MLGQFLPERDSPAVDGDRLVNVAQGLDEGQAGACQPSRHLDLLARRLDLAFPANPGDDAGWQAERVFSAVRMISAPMLLMPA